MRRRERAAPYEEERDGDGAGDPRDPRRTRREASQGGMQVSRHHRFLAAARRVCSSLLCCRCATDHRSASATQEEPEKTREETSDELKEKTDEGRKEEETDEVPKEEEKMVEEPEEEQTAEEPREEEMDEKPKETDEQPKEETTDEVPKEEETDEQPKEKEMDEQPMEEEKTDEQPKEKMDEQPKEEEKTDEQPKERMDEQPEEDEELKKETDEEPILQPEERTAFFRCLEEDHIKMFLARDSCYKISDKYLLAMVLMYFRRADLCTKEYSLFFYPALFLANQMEEDESFRREIYPWALGPFWTMTMDWFLHLRNYLLEGMGFQAWVVRATCDLIMAQDPEHWAWKRERKEHHSWAIRWCRRDREEYILKGPWGIPPPCSLCNIHLHPCAGEENIQCRTDATAEPGAAESPTCPMCHCQEGACTFLETML